MQREIFIVSIESMEATKGLAPSVKRIKFEDSEFGNFMVRVRRAEIVWRVIGLLGFTLPFIILFENAFFFFFFARIYGAFN